MTQKDADPLVTKFDSLFATDSPKILKIDSIIQQLRRNGRDEAADAVLRALTDKIDVPTGSVYRVSMRRVADVLSGAGFPVGQTAVTKWRERWERDHGQPGA